MSARCAESDAGCYELEGNGAVLQAMDDNEVGWDMAVWFGLR